MLKNREQASIRFTVYHLYNKTLESVVVVVGGGIVWMGIPDEGCNTLKSRVSASLTSPLVLGISYCSVRLD